MAQEGLTWDRVSDMLAKITIQADSPKAGQGLGACMLHDGAGTSSVSRVQIGCVKAERNGTNVPLAAP